MLAPGTKVWWHRTLGGGGGSGKRPNKKEAVPALVTKVGRHAVQIGPHAAATHEPLLYRTTWVRPENVTLREE